MKHCIAPVDLGLDQAIPCGLIVNELVSNCFKHAFPGERHGQITIELRDEDGDLVLSVGDDAVGMLQWQDCQADTLGMQLVSGLAQQIGGAVEAKSHLGTVFQVRFAAHHRGPTHESGKDSYC